MSTTDKLEFLNINNNLYQTRISNKFKNRIKYKPADPRLVLSFIPGTVLEIFVSPGQSVKKGDLLLILDAMKMQNRLKCPMHGKVKNFSVNKGDKVSKGTLLMELD